ncbi:methyl-accepting chemotaxis protein [Pleomorphomonas carboxyditropha]|uniref:Chemotaxis protein n=1 Tax=Pleomorphomonas carboxyditropha TaxID=2023338 RepID=A0A2G9WNX6_9HYPH|nr:PAS domain-containing methyl-accepting chemotaxis protein [Pleomorphomonas carboxyditropha]PIO96355.1 chemotaxis protein [Pleomorphomonas carboxyditropha]
MIGNSLPILGKTSYDRRAKLDALNKSQAIVEFDVSGKVLWANENFLTLLGYTLPEIKGKHHSLFVAPKLHNSPEYKAFEDNLRRGLFQSGEFHRIGKGGKDIWIQATYNPLLDRSGKPYKIVKFAIDVTAQKIEYAELRGQIEAINKSQAVIAFSMDGIVLDANENFMTALGYTLSEIKDKHHSMFVDPAYRSSSEYKQFWDDLRSGKFQAAEYKRIGKNGREVWIQATYNPIFDPAGHLIKVVKFATDITKEVLERQRKAEVSKTIDSDLGSIAEAITHAAERAASSAAASNQTSANVQAVAAGSEELAHSVSEISRQVTNALEISQSAVAQANRTNTTMTTLNTAVQKIGEVVDLINTIAAQTNLLALNATIEAARAGDAGKGFAVVASEVKQLASQTSKATDEIAGQIAAVQMNTTEATGAIGEISSTIAKINEISASIASAVEEQEAVTTDMSANMQTAAQGVEIITQGMNDIAAAARQVDGSVKKVKEASRSIA